MLASVPALAQGGPPLLTDDPGTPGNRNWEINVAYTQDRRPDSNQYDVPILDINYGVGITFNLSFRFLISTPAAMTARWAVDSAIRSRA